MHSRNVAWCILLWQKNRQANEKGKDLAGGGYDVIDN